MHEIDVAVNVGEGVEPPVDPERVEAAVRHALHEEGEEMVGDVYVGVDQARRQAAEFGATPAEEVLRLAIHGTLHVLGYDHPEGEERAGSEMFGVQEELLRAFLRSQS